MTHNLLYPHLKCVPEDLRKHPYWCVWPAEPRSSGGYNKRPVGTKGYPIATNRTQGWDSFTNTLAFYEANKGTILHDLKGPISGIGILLHQSCEIVGIDFDHAVNPDGTIAQWARPLITELMKITYCELSPSGTGIHAYLYGKKPDGKCKGGPDNNLEIYEWGRFLTVTGYKLDDCANKIASGKEAQAIIDKLVAFIQDNKKTNSTKKEKRNPLQEDIKPLVNSGPEWMTDYELVARARQARNGKLFSALYDSGDISGHPSASEADQALCNILAFWTNRDAFRIDQLMRQSALLRDPERIAKWDRVHVQGATYGEATIAKAIADCQNVYSPKGKSAKRTHSNSETINPNFFPLAEDDLAVRFVAKHRGNMRYCHDSGKWYSWNGQIWQREETQEAIDLMRIVCKEAAKLAGTKERKGLLRSQLYKHALEIAQTDRAVAVTSRIWDADKFLLGTPDGTVDLKTGELRKATQTDFITKTTRVTPANTPPHLWTKFLDEATAGDKELQRFMQQIAGMVLTGDTSEHALFFVYGPGGNGKSVFLTAITEILQDYAVTAAMETFISSQSDRHPTEVAMLKGARLVTASETEEGRNWAESKIKQLTGGDEITARFMRQDFFTFLPQFKLLIIGNHKPSIRNLDEAIKRRMNIIPFTQIPQEKDTRLSEKLRAEYPSILQWMIEGCLDWQQNGLQRPQCVKEATDDYFADQDLFSQWIRECCQTDPVFAGKSSELFASWQDFANQNGIKPGNSKSFASDMEKRGYPKIRDSRGQKFKGICAKNDTTGEKRGI